VTPSRSGRRDSLSAVRGFLPALVGLAVLAACGPGGGDGETPYDLERLYYEAAIDRTAFVAECLTERGFSVSVYGGMSLQYNVPAEQLEVMAPVEDDCWQEAEARYPYAPPPTEDELYDLYLEAARCLEEEGFPIPSPPTRESWTDAYPEENVWAPHAFVPNLGKAAWFRINRTCPQPGIR